MNNNNIPIDQASEDAAEVKSGSGTAPQAPMSIAIRMISVLGGVFSSGFLFGFLYYAIADSGFLQVVLGLVLVVGAIWFNSKSNLLFLESAAITIYIVGVLTLCNGLAAMYNSDFTFIALLFIGVAGVTFAITRGWLFPFVAVLLFNVALFFLLDYNFERLHLMISINVIMMIVGVAYFLICFFEARIVAAKSIFSRHFSPLQAGYFVSFVVLLGAVSSENFYVSARFVSQDDTIVGLSLLTVALPLLAGLLFIISRIIRVLKVEKLMTKVLIYALSLMFIIPTLYAPYLSGAVLLLLTSFHYRYKSQVVISCAMLCYGLVLYYYNLDLTLLAKAGILLLSGVLIIIIWYYLAKNIKNNEAI